MCNYRCTFLKCFQDYLHRFLLLYNKAVVEPIVCIVLVSFCRTKRPRINQPAEHLHEPYWAASSKADLLVFLISEDSQQSEVNLMCSYRAQKSRRNLINHLCRFPPGNTHTRTHTRTHTHTNTRTHTHFYKTQDAHICPAVSESFLMYDCDIRLRQSQMEKHKLQCVFPYCQNDYH